MCLRIRPWQGRASQIIAWRRGDVDVAFKTFLFEHVILKEGLVDVNMIDKHVFSSGKSPLACGTGEYECSYFTPCFMCCPCNTSRTFNLPRDMSS